MSTITESDLERMLFDEDAEPMAIPFLVLSKITKGFSDELEIGRGNFAIVYKAMLKNGCVAVKRLKSNAYLYEKEFQRETECLMKVRHKNIVQFIGYCAETTGLVESYEGKFVIADIQHRLLCFEYLPKGSLHDYIKDVYCGLEWRQRYKIIKGICEGLCYLHQKNILHLDLKPSNILLDDNMLPKITDFGLSRCFDEDQTRLDASKVGGTIGYLAPEYTSHVITQKFDVYSLGVVMMEIITGNKGYQAINDVLESWSNRLQISQDSPEWEQIKVCAEIGMQCTKFNPAKRPRSMKDIVDRLAETEVDEVFSKDSTKTAAPRSRDFSAGNEDPDAEPSGSMLRSIDESAEDPAGEPSHAQSRLAFSGEATTLWSHPDARRRRMLDLKKKVGEKLEEKRRQVEEKERQMEVQTGGEQGANTKVKEFLRGLALKRGAPIRRS